MGCASIRNAKSTANVASVQPGSGTAFSLLPAQSAAIVVIRIEAQNTGLVDCLLGSHPLVPLRLHGKVDQHDRVLIDDANQQENADDCNDGKIEVKGYKHQQGANASDLMARACDRVRLWPDKGVQSSG